MKLLNFWRNDSQHLGVKMDQGVIDVLSATSGREDVPTTMDALINGGSGSLHSLRGFLRKLPDNLDSLLDESQLHYAPPIANPEKIICVGLNYRQHARESKMAIPEVPLLFSKYNNTIAGARESIPLTSNASQYDYEVELGVVIGLEARNVGEDEALDFVLGYCTANDLSARDLQLKTSQWLIGKTPDKFMPLGPYLVTPDEIEDPQNLWLRSWVNGELRQNSNTSDMIFTVAEIISYISQYLTLKPGDIILTGTPEGVILGMMEKNWLKPGDEVAVEVENLSRCVNKMIPEN